MPVNSKKKDNKNDVPVYQSVIYVDSKSINVWTTT